MSQPQQWYPPPPFRALPLPPGVTYASWWARGAAFVVDVVALFALLAPAGGIGGGLATALEDPQTGEPPAWIFAVIAALFVVALGVWLWMFCWQAGSVGQTWGKRVVGIHLVSERTLRPPGGWIGVARYGLRTAIGNASCGVYSLVTMLWPLWDERNQTLDDKMVNTVVVRFPDRRPPDPAPAVSRPW